MSIKKGVPNKIFMQNMKVFFHVHDIKHKDLAEEMGLTPAGISDILNGRNYPSHNFLLHMAKKYGISIDWLLLDEGQMKMGEVDPRIVQIFRDQRADAESGAGMVEKLEQLIKDLHKRQEVFEKNVTNKLEMSEH